ncbi:hypothetical protein IFM53868_05780 [Aspergillus udagawae]|uniref:RRM domain-containing protein n=1 Tax=Aspergillus udagawae TaxID=91492 RepID=A0ABQ1AWC6_9EURO|nr:hypothetical protein IFM53868_05780 [Aspergillus udagawae]GFG15331.1 hypothetical protein IFM5058_07399 [Aspergillus udagawae]
MEGKDTNSQVSGHESGYPFTSPYPQSYNVLPFGAPGMPGFSPRPGQYMAPGNPNLSQPVQPEGPFMYSPFYGMQVMAHALPGAIGQAPGMQSPLPISNTQLQLSVRPKQTGFAPAGSHWAPRSSLHQLLEHDSENREIATRAVDCEKSFDTVALPTEMPIGSQIHKRMPPQWGVVKIANIPYSVTRQEIIQFLGRQARLITPQQGCAIHIIMERSTAKTMDCYAEFQSMSDAQETATRINRIYETGRAPRLGNRSVDVEFSNQDALLKDLFPRAKCIFWKDAMPTAVPNDDPFSTGFSGFFTSEEIVNAIRHAEIPHRSPFCAKCPQRTYESTISTLYKFPWYATKLYTVHDRNQLFELANRHILSLVARVKRSNTVGLDQRLLRELLYAGLNCPAFNERQKYTLCVNSEDTTEILKFPDMGKWFPFDTLVKLPQTEECTLLVCLPFLDLSKLCSFLGPGLARTDGLSIQYYVKLISKGTLHDRTDMKLTNNFPLTNIHLESPYGPIWFEWPSNMAKTMAWEDASAHEMSILSHLVLTGWMRNDQENTKKSGLLPESTTASSRESHANTIVSPGSDNSPINVRTSSRTDIFATPSRRASVQLGSRSFFAESSDDGWHRAMYMHSSAGMRGRFPGHRNTLSSPTCLPSAGYH